VNCTEEIDLSFGRAAGNGKTAALKFLCAVKNPLQRSPSLEKLCFSIRVAPDLHTIKSQRIGHFPLKRQVSRRVTANPCPGRPGFAMAVLGLVATWIPAQRALSVDPLVPLREE
jgi:hypothetical protein